ncbi:plasminogen-like [Ruditapes philippinarum]|uniref:plasminogen-like n=1 Tax=Ruditapes philippinarum TaxID=129788 RepID=UPI00295BC3DE|nr:plasminogen-like [Ruditapes philippinarum]
MYSGTLNVTLNGHTCQRWDSQQPHEHVRNTTHFFPNDASVFDAHNYCRGAGESDELWCYTTNEMERWDYCISPNDTCQDSDVGALSCSYLPFGKNSTHCPNNTLNYYCEDGFGEGNSVYVSIYYELECTRYSCCVPWLSTILTSSKGESVATQASDNIDNISTIFPEEDSSTTSVIEITTPMSSGICSTSNFNMYMLLFVLSILLLP